jgi:hypothetical protein
LKTAGNPRRRDEGKPAGIETPWQLNAEPLYSGIVSTADDSCVELKWIFHK